MKRITTIITIFITVLGCTAQEPDAYSQPIVDSLNAVIVQKDAQIENQDAILENLLQEPRTDTMSFELDDGDIYISVIKKGSNVWFTLVDGIERINADYIDRKRTVMLMDSTYTVGSLYVY